MGYRYTRLAAGAIIALAFSQLTNLLRPTASGPPWQFVILAGLFLGAVITWTGLTYRLAGWIVSLVNLVALTIVAFRIATPDTLAFLVPTAASLGEMQTQLDQAMTIIRNGIEPVIPVSGLVVIVTAVFWVLGVVTATALVRGRPALAVIPGLVLSLQFATMDRSPTSMWLVTAFVGVLAAAVLAVTWDQRIATAGRMAHVSGWRPSRSLFGPATTATLVVTLVGSLLAVAVFGSAVPHHGVLAWRAASGLTGGFFGSVSYNPFVEIHQSLLSQSDVPLFQARITGDVPPDRVFFRLLTLEAYEGGRFFANRPDVEPLDADQWEAGGHSFAGPTATVTTDILIDRLSQDWLPAAYTPVSVRGEDALTGSLRVRKDDGSLILDGGLSYPGLLYSVTSAVPQPDLAVLAAGADGELSPLFSEPAEEGLAVPQPVAATLREEPPDVERYLQLPDDLDRGIRQLARSKTSNLDTPFEVGLALEAWLRSSDFRYTTDIEPGQGATDLAEWLLDRYADTPNHRTGYCENFATAMAVMARTLGVPSRVVLGFTPGERTGTANVVVVRDRNAHAWVELWIPSQGWVRFDPTPRADRINPTTSSDVARELGYDLVAYFDDIPAVVLRPGEVPPRFFDPGAIPDDELFIDPSAFDAPAGGGGFGFPDWAQPVAVAAAVVLLLGGGIPLTKWLRRRRRFARLRSGDIVAAWEEIVTRLTDFGERPEASLTPDELAARVDPAMQPLAAVYGRAVYGPPGSLVGGHVATAERSLTQTAERLNGRYSRLERLVAWYRPASLLPKWLLRMRRRR